MDKSSSQNKGDGKRLIGGALVILTTELISLSYILCSLASENTLDVQQACYMQQLEYTALEIQKLVHK